MYVMPSASIRRRTSLTSSSRPSALTKRSRSVATVSSLLPVAGRLHTNARSMGQVRSRVVTDKGEQLTAAQREALEAELAELEGPRRAAAVEAIKTARSFGDLSENFEYHAAKNEQGMLEARIRTRGTGSHCGHRRARHGRPRRCRLVGGDRGRERRDDGGRDLRGRRRLSGLPARRGRSWARRSATGSTSRRHTGRGRRAWCRSGALAHRAERASANNPIAVNAIGTRQIIVASGVVTGRDPFVLVRCGPSADHLS